MSLLEIKKYGDPVLRAVCEPVGEITPELRRLVRNMFETMYAAPGSGLAANQVGVPLRLCVIDVRPDDKRQPVVLINPRIVHRQEKVTVQEGCLSIPGLLVEMKRFRQVRVEALNERGFPVVINGEDFFAQALQHEIDHLDGKIYVDYLSPSRKKALEQEIEKRRKRGQL